MSEQKNLDIPKNQFEKIPSFPQIKETPSVPEKRPESSSEQLDKVASAQINQLGSALANDVSQAQGANYNSEIILEKVEEILSKDMDHVFLSMDASTQLAFKQKGEETAQKINTILKSTKVKFNEVLNLIIDWLKIIPKVNKYYLEQEAKIKADAIIKLHSKNDN